MNKEIVLNDINRVYFSDKPIAIATDCKISCDTANEGSKDWSSVHELSFTIKSPIGLFPFRLQYGVSNWLEWHDGLVKRFWYGYSKY